MVGLVKLLLNIYSEAKVFKGAHDKLCHGECGRCPTKCPMCGLAKAVAEYERARDAP
jgi:ferredoxin